MSFGVPGVEHYEEIGRGGSAVVYRGWQPEFGRWVAIKIFPPDLDPRRLERERLAVGRVSDHPGIAPVFGGGVTTDGRPYLVMGYMEGGSLGDRVAARGALPVPEVVAFGTAMASALQVAHDHGIWHRDLKPANILYDRFGTPRLADFGIAHLDDDGFRTGVGMISGTVAYMAPELLMGQPFTAAADVFSLGATLYYALHARDLFTPRPEEAHQAFLMRRLLEPEPPYVAPHVPPWLRQVLLAATDPEPTRRIPTAAALAAALGSGGVTVVATSEPAPGAANQWPAAPYGQADVTSTLASHPYDRPAATAHGRTSSRRAGAVSLAVIVALAAGGGLWLTRQKDAAAGVLTQPSPSAAVSTGSAGRSAAGQTSTANRSTPATATSAPSTVAPSTVAPTAPDAQPVSAVFLRAVEAYRQAVGGKDPLAVEMTFHLTTIEGLAVSGSATLPQPGNPALSDRYDYRDGVVGQPEAVPAGAQTARAEQWRFSEVDWKRMGAMLRSTEQVCRASMAAAKVPDEEKITGDKAGISHVIVERDTVFNDGAVVVRVYFDGGARWSGGYVPFTGAGKLLTKRYCVVG